MTIGVVSPTPERGVCVEGADESDIEIDVDDIFEGLAGEVDLDGLGVRPFTAHDIVVVDAPAVRAVILSPSARGVMGGVDVFGDIREWYLNGLCVGRLCVARLTVERSSPTEDLSFVGERTRMAEAERDLEDEDDDGRLERLLAISRQLRPGGRRVAIFDRLSARPRSGGQGEKKR